jgi:hypothetical protein
MRSRLVFEHPGQSSRFLNSCPQSYRKGEGCLRADQISHELFFDEPCFCCCVRSFKLVHTLMLYCIDFRGGCDGDLR